MGRPQPPHGLNQWFLAGTTTFFDASQNKFLKKMVSIDTLVAGVLHILREGLRVLAHA